MMQAPEAGPDHETDEAHAEKAQGNRRRHLNRRYRRQGRLIITDKRLAVRDNRIPTPLPELLVTVAGPRLRSRASTKARNATEASERPATIPRP
jgi:hypothetical protein